MDKEVLKRQLVERCQQAPDEALRAVDEAPDGQWIAASEWEVRNIFQKLTGGEIELSRRYFWAKGHGGVFPADVPVGKEELRQLVEAEGTGITQARNSGKVKAAWTSADAKVKNAVTGEVTTRVYDGVDGVPAPTVTQQEKGNRRKNTWFAVNSVRRRAWATPSPCRQRGRAPTSDSRR
jgi:hypothetical protein